MSKIKNKNNKNNKKVIITSIFILGIGIIAGFSLTMENYTAQEELLRNFKDVPGAIEYEGKLAECDNNKNSCIKIGSGGQIERLE
jgi:hypothetical protein